MNRSELLDQLTIEENQRVGAMPRYVIWLFIAALATLAGIAGWFILKEKGQAIPVDLATITHAHNSTAQQHSVLDASGYVVARQKATVSAEITGKLVAVLVEEGMSIDEGQVLARLDDSLIVSELALARAQFAVTQQALAEKQIELKESERELQRIRSLVERSLASTKSLDDAITAYDLRQAAIKEQRLQINIVRENVQLQQKRLDDTVIRAPFSGVVVAKNAQIGEIVSPISAGGGFTRTGICTIVDMNSLEIEVDVNEAYIQRVSPKQSATARLDAYPDWEIPVEVKAIVPTADRQKATVKVRLAFLERDSRVLPDMGIDVSFLEAGSPPVAAPADAAALLIPKSAVRYEEDKAVAYVLIDDQVSKREINLKVRAQNADVYEVISGLTAGDVVVASNLDKLTNGAKVRVRK